MKKRFTSDVKMHHANNILYAPPGAGKTHSARTIPEPETVRIINAEAGLLSLRDVKIESWEIEEWKDIDKTINYLKLPSDDKARVENKDDNIKTLFIDSATEITKKCCEQVLKERVGIVAARGKALDTIFQDQLTLEDWGVIKGRIDRMFRAFRDLPYNIIFTALQHERESSESGMTKKMPLLFPQSLSETVPGYFDEVYIMKSALDKKKDEIVRWWETFDDGNQIAKSRLGNLERKMLPDWSVVFKSLGGGKK